MLYVPLYAAILIYKTEQNILGVHSVYRSLLYTVSFFLVCRDSKPEDPQRRMLRHGFSSGGSTEVNVGSLKDKKRGPGPRLSR